MLELVLLAAVAAAGIAAANYGLDRYYRGAYPMKYAELIDAACAEKGLDRALVYAVVRTESGFRPDAVSPAGARGLMQMMPDAFDWVQMRRGESPRMDVEALFDPEINIDYGTSMLKLLQTELKETGNVLCAYHAGRGKALEWLADPEYAPDGARITNIPFEDTRDYVAKVQKTMAVYQRLYQI